MSTQSCEGCGKPTKGGHRFCYRCLAELLSQPTEPAKPALRESNLTYPLPRKKR